MAKPEQKSIIRNVFAVFLDKIEYTRIFPNVVRVLLCILIGIILFSIAGGVAKTFIDASTVMESPLEEILRKIIVDVLILLAVVEIYKTTYTYFSEGRVRVTYIVDTVLVVMLSEVISSWFKNDHSSKLLMLIAILAALMGIRILAIYFHPKKEG
ncbi:phosphate-starvation-inducible PsiE family protein [Candidatus Curtissbacteria bacterium]|nr:phosphate-starvation-inducible PsiE family protein [Candidatus Curtissbacteria bacterium]